MKPLSSDLALRATLVASLLALGLAVTLGAGRAAANPTFWGAPGNGPGQFDRPWDVAVGAAGEVLVADSGNHRVQRLGAAGALLGEFGSFGSDPGQFGDGLVGVAVAPDGKVFVLDRRGPADAGFRVQRFSAAGEFELGWGTEEGAALGQFGEPTDIAVGPDGRVYVAEAGNHRVQSFASDGTDPAAWGSAGSGGAGEFAEPVGLAIAADSSVFVADGGGTPEVQVFDADGGFVAGWGTTGPLEGQLRANGLAGIAVAPDGSVVLRDHDPLSVESNRFQRFSAAGTLLAPARWSPGAEPHGLALTATRLYAPDPAGGRIQVFDLTRPSVSLIAPYLPVGVGETAVFQASASVPLGRIVKHEWDLDGDGRFELDTGTVPEARRSFAQVGTHTARLRVTSDLGGTAVEDRQFVIDVAPPPGPLGVTINDGAQFTRTPHVTLSVRWPRWETSMLISNDGGFGAAAERPVAAEIPWRLGPAGSERLPQVVYVRFGEQGRTFQDDIVLDRRRPTIRVTYVRVGGGGKRLRLAARDRVSGVESMQVKRGGRTKEWRKFRSSLKVRGPIRNLRVRVRDRAGNLSGWVVPHRPGRR